MLFNSFEFILFLPIVIFAYYLIPQKFRWTLLLLASYFFYASWKVEYLILIIASTLIDYWCGLKMGNYETKKKRKPFLILSLISNLGLLFTFKYYNFFVESINDSFISLLDAEELPLWESLILPVGISFYTFQTLSYAIDVYKGKQEPEKHLGYFALYVSFFPQLVAGPIERFSTLTPQFKKAIKFNYIDFANGVRLIIYGLFVKMVIADNLAELIDPVYENPETYSSLAVTKSIFLYPFQIYGDFYGYSMVAIGSALLMGIKIMDNFKTPYLSKSIAEFWQRWHISLSTWFRDYLYFPMGGNRVSKGRWFYNVFVVFVLSGIWHGANWNFIIWGALFGVIYWIEKSIKLKGLSSKLLDVTLMLKTFIITSLIWVFFRSENLTDALNHFSLAVNPSIKDSLELAIPITTAVMLFLFILSDILLYNKRFDIAVGKMNIVLRWGIYMTVVFCVIVFASVKSHNYIYFQF